MQLKNLLNPVQTIIKILDNRIVYIAAIILLILFSFRSCQNNKDLQSQIDTSEQTIDDLTFKNKELKLSDSTKALEIEAITYKSSKDIERLRDSLSISMGKISRLQKELGIIKFNSTFKPGKIPVIPVDTATKNATDSLKTLPCDSLRNLADSNLLKVPAPFELLNKHYAFKGKILREGIQFDPTYPRVYSKPTIIFGEKRSWFLGKWKTTAQIGDENPYVEITDGKYIQVRNKERKFGVTVGYGVLYNIQQKKFTTGPAVLFGYRF